MRSRVEPGRKIGVTAQHPEQLMQVWLGTLPVSYRDNLERRGNPAPADLAAYRMLP
jgi:hypothetical protein